MTNNYGFKITIHKIFNKIIYTLLNIGTVSDFLKEWKINLNRASEAVVNISLFNFKTILSHFLFSFDTNFCF